MEITEKDRNVLLQLAREAVTAAVTGAPRPRPDVSQGLLSEPRGCFVTLTRNGQLRGCIGTFQPQSPLGQTVVDMGISATQDPRFTSDPITAGELPDLTVEVSVLSPLKKTDHPEELEIGRHGIYILGAGRGGCFLPEVATDHHMTPEEFLDTCCQHKAGLPTGAWRRGDVQVYLFTSEKFSDSPEK